MAIEPFTDDRGDYDCAAEPIGEGGFARAYSATHRPSGQRVVLKELKPTASDIAIQRMRREVDVMRSLGGNSHVMPVLASDPENRWYVMPPAEGSVTKLQSQLNTPESQAQVVLAAAKALQEAHAQGIVHRDVTPGNILRLPGGTWVLADFGLVRRPLGETTHLWTTHVVGTVGYLAPELTDSHNDATPASDTYGLARVLEYIVGGAHPLPGRTDPGPSRFRRAIRQAIADDPTSRSSLSDFVRNVEAALRPFPTLGPSVEELSQKAREGDRAATQQLLRLSLDRPEDGDLYLDEIVDIDHKALVAELADLDPAEFRSIVKAMDHHLEHNFGYRSFDRLPTMVFWFQRAAEAAQMSGDLALFEDVAEVFLKLDSSLDRWRQKPRSDAWLADLTGAHAEIVGRIALENDKISQYYATPHPPERMHRSLAAVLIQAAGAAR